MRDRIKRGENHIHIITDLLQSIEEDDCDEHSDESAETKEGATNLAELDKSMDSISVYIYNEENYYKRHITNE